MSRFPDAGTTEEQAAWLQHFGCGACSRVADLLLAHGAEVQRLENKIQCLADRLEAAEDEVFDLLARPINYEA